MADKFEDRYRKMSDDELLGIAADGEDLSEEAGQALDAEVARRGIIGQVTRREERMVVSDEVRDLVLVARYVNLVQAQLAQGALISAGIHAVLWDDNMVRMDWGAIPAIGGIRLVVDRAEAAAAREILDSPVVVTTHSNDKESFEHPQCPHCGSPETFLDYSDDPAIERWRCDACSYCWTSNIT